METKSNNGVIGLVLIGLGTGMVAAGVALAAPVCLAWSSDKLQKAYRKGKEGMISGFETAADAFNEVASKAQSPLGEAARAARQTTAIAAGAVESAAHFVREQIAKSEHFIPRGEA